MSGSQFYWTNLLGWFDTDKAARNMGGSETTNWLRTLPFVVCHIMCFAVIWVGISPVAVGVAILMYGLRMFAITGFYHRYFSHRSFKTSRTCQFFFALIGCMAVQRGPLWWAAHHRVHHRFSDDEKDVHSPKHQGFFWSHVGWFTCDVHFPTQYERVKDFARYPELRLLNRFDTLVPILYGFGLYFLGAALAHWQPQWGTSGMQMLVWGFFISTVCLWHVTFCVNSMAHMFGKRRYNTADDSRNNWWIALLTLGEGWHNNHHHFPASARQGFFWWEIDITYYVLKAMAAVRLVWDLKPVPEVIRYRHLEKVSS